MPNADAVWLLMMQQPLTLAILSSTLICLVHRPHRLINSSPSANPHNIPSPQQQTDL
jgi:hypothetical protein